MVIAALISAGVVLAAVQIWVLNPLAARPGTSLATIYAEMRQAGQFSVLGETLGALTLVSGLVVAAALLREGLRPPGLPTAGIVMVGGLCMALAVPAYWWASFSMGMSLADTYGIGGGDHSPWARPLFGLSAMGLAAVVVGAVSGSWTWKSRVPPAGGSARRA